MSHTEPDPLAPIGQSPEWEEWFLQALAEFEHVRLIGARELSEWKPIELRLDPFEEIIVHDERAHVRHDLVPLVRASVRDYIISRHPWEFTP